MDKVAEFDAGPNPIDRHVGLRIRLRRKELGISQERLAETIGLTFQQVQKYERAANRVSASKLWEVARALETNIGYFYEGLPTEGEMRRRSGPKLEDFLLTAEGMELARYFPQIPQQGIRRQILELVRTMAVEPEGG
ncbi:MAG TPA: helix-turn-helix transcriptional regulator [Phenylobacterium sp.]|uniref:helix-turn-helix domain-containing protein n=1 Tax=Phenylobacterium sp. TaxID=1871053 RepID=UPI002B4A2AE4|nr:helix-turn-helix transcriptional regulator [Phenylobacterium sp.]HKR88626.1 helix-turn-helix transcriptional regulator [Phenylobacterium sp.]